MTEHPNVEQARRGYEAFAKGDVTTMSELIADDVIWHAKGVGPLSGDYHGRDQVFGFFGRLAGTSRPRASAIARTWCGPAPQQMPM